MAKRTRRRSLRSAVARLHATPDQLRDALGVCADLHPVYRRLLAMTLDELEVMEAHLQQLDEELAQLLRVHQDAVERLAAVPGLGVDSAQQIIAEVGPTAATFASGEAPGVVGRRLSWARRERGRQSQPSSAERQSADASAAQSGGERCCEDERQYLRSCCIDASSSGSGTRKPLGPLHTGSVGWCGRSCTTALSYDERGPAVTKHRAQRRAAKMIRELRSLGYRVEPGLPPASALA